jgi:hypothetical protein
LNCEISQLTEEVSFPPEVDDLAALKRIQKVITSGEAQVSFLREYRVDKANLAAEIRGLVENTANYTNKEKMEASDTYARMRYIVNNLADNFWAILTPSAVDEAPSGLTIWSPRLSILCGRRVLSVVCICIGFISR